MALNASYSTGYALFRRCFEKKFKIIRAQKSACYLVLGPNFRKKWGDVVNFGGKW